MATEFGTGKTVFILAIVVGCFAVLWPKIFYPMLQGSVAPKPPEVTTNNECCDVIFEKDVTLIKIMTELCEEILRHQEDFDKRLVMNFQQGKLTKEIIDRCKQEVMTKCDIDITAFLEEKVRLGKSYNQILHDIRSLNSSICLKENFGVTPNSLGAPRYLKIWTLTTAKHLRQERPPHLRPEILHPALREKGRAIPQSHIVPKVVEKEGRPPPVPGMRPPMGGAGHVVPAPKGGSTMGIIMPMYTIGIVIFFMYTMMKLLFKKSDDTTAYKELKPDPEFRRVVFNESDYYASRTPHHPHKVEEESATKLGWKERDAIVTAISGLVAEVQRDILSKQLITDSPNKAEESETDVFEKEISSPEEAIKLAKQEPNLQGDGNSRSKRSIDTYNQGSYDLEKESDDVSIDHVAEISKENHGDPSIPSKDNYEEEIFDDEISKGEEIQEIIKMEAKKLDEILSQLPERKVTNIEDIIVEKLDSKLDESESKMYVGVKTEADDLIEDSLSKEEEINEKISIDDGKEIGKIDESIDENSGGGLLDKTDEEVLGESQTLPDESIEISSTYEQKNDVIEKENNETSKPAINYGEEISDIETSITDEFEKERANEIICEETLDESQPHDEVLVNSDNSPILMKTDETFNLLNDDITLSNQTLASENYEQEVFTDQLINTTEVPSVSSPVGDGNIRNDESLNEIAKEISKFELSDSTDFKESNIVELRKDSDSIVEEKSNSSKHSIVSHENPNEVVQTLEDNVMDEQSDVFEVDESESDILKLESEKMSFGDDFEEDANEIEVEGKYGSRDFEDVEIGGIENTSELDNEEKNGIELTSSDLNSNIQESLMDDSFNNKDEFPNLLEHKDTPSTVDLEDPDDPHNIYSYKDDFFISGKNEATEKSDDIPLEEVNRVDDYSPSKTYSDHGSTKVSDDRVNKNDEEEEEEEEDEEKEESEEEEEEIEERDEEEEEERGDGEIVRKMELEEDDEEEDLEDEEDAIEIKQEIGKRHVQFENDEEEEEEDEEEDDEEEEQEEEVEEEEKGMGERHRKVDFNTQPADSSTGTDLKVDSSKDQSLNGNRKLVDDHDENEEETDDEEEENDEDDDDNGNQRNTTTSSRQH